MSEHAHRGPRELVDRAMELLLAHDMAGFAGLWAAEGTMEFPFAPEGYPERLDGRDAVTEYLRDYTDHVDLRAITRRTVHQTLDPEVVVVEFEVDGVAVRTGRSYRMRYISVITVRHGEIVGYRDYWSPQAAADALGGADELTALGTSDAGR
jgi:uncharacterized protein